MNEQPTELYDETHWFPAFAEAARTLADIFTNYDLVSCMDEFEDDGRNTILADIHLARLAVEQIQAALLVPATDPIIHGPATANAKRREG